MNASGDKSMLKRNRTIIVGPAVVINHSQAGKLGSKNGNKCTFTLVFQQRRKARQRTEV